MTPARLLRRAARAGELARARLSPLGYLGLKLSLGALVLVAAGWLFGGITEDVVNGDPLTQIDLVVANWFASHTISALTRAMLAISSLHGPIPMTAMVCGFGLFLLWQRKWQWLMIFIIAVPGASSSTP